MLARLHVVISGRVQGVGFRYATARQAASLGLAGFVRNRSDGGVEAEFEGEREPLEQMLEWCRNGPSYARVTDVAPTWEEDVPARWDQFYIRG